VATAERLADALPAARLHVAETLEQLQSWGQIASEFLDETA
jgi:hypothetical protein